MLKKMLSWDGLTWIAIVAFIVYTFVFFYFARNRNRKYYSAKYVISWQLGSGIFGPSSELHLSDSIVSQTASSIIFIDNEDRTVIQRNGDYKLTIQH